MSVAPVTLQERFQSLVAEWQEETRYLSSTTQIAIHPAYQRIIGMGPDALPLIFRQMQRAPGHWFWALKAITGEDPVMPGHAGSLPEMTRDWLRWAREHSYLA
jgi:hypothetical protein